MANDCNTPTFVVQTGLSRTLTPESGIARSFVEQVAAVPVFTAQDCSDVLMTIEVPAEQIRLGDEECCGFAPGTVIDITDFIYDGTWFADGSAFARGYA